MSIKKLVILPAGFILIHVLYIGCCKCLEGTFFRDIKGITASHYTPVTNNNVDTVFTNDSLTTIIQLNYQLIARAKVNPFATFTGAAYALSCECFTDDRGFKFPIDSLVITSNNNFNGVPAGNNLANFFKGYGNCRNFSSTAINYIPINQVIDSINTCKYAEVIYITTATQPGVNKVHNFKYSLFFNGKKFDAAGNKLVKWL